MSTIKIGTRGSPLALAQAHMVADAIREHGVHDAEIVVIKVKGDQILDRPLADVGGKGLFTKEIQAALLAGEVQCAVHSAKDLETVLPAPLTLGAMLPREDVRDVFIGRDGMGLAELPEGAVVGTASLRRQALVRRARPDLKLAILRGNVGTRLKKLAAGEVDATLLALAGLKRLGQAHVATEILDAQRFPPALSQGAIAVEVRRDDDEMLEVAAALNHAETETAVSAARGFLAALDGSCRTPIAGLAEVRGERVHLSAMVASHDGARIEEIEGSGEASRAAELGYDLGAKLRARIGEAFFEDWR